MLRAIARLVGDIANLFDDTGDRLWFVLLGALLLQAGYWYLGSPGSTLLRLAPRSLPTALSNILWALLFLFAIPLALSWLLDLKAADIGLRWGNVRFGLAATTGVGVIAAVVLFFATTDPNIQRVYPWPGAWLGANLGRILVWAILYGFYYLSFEFFYRGFLLRALEPYWGITSAVWIQTLLSTLIHLGKPLTEVVAAIPAGLLFAALAVRSRSLFYPIMLHLFIGLGTDLFSLYHQGLLLH